MSPANVILAVGVGMYVIGAAIGCGLGSSIEKRGGWRAWGRSLRRGVLYRPDTIFTLHRGRVLRVRVVEYDVPEQGIESGKALAFEVWDPTERSGVFVWLRYGDVNMLRGALWRWLNEPDELKP